MVVCQSKFKKYLVNKMKKSDLIRSIQVQFKHIRANDAAVMLDSVIADLIRGVAAGDRVEIRGFGIFIPRIRVAKTAFNPRTGQPMQLSAGKTILFKPSTILTQNMNG